MSRTISLKNAKGVNIRCQHFDLGFSHADGAYVSIFKLDGGAEIQVNCHKDQVTVNGANARWEHDLKALQEYGYEIAGF